MTRAIGTKQQLYESMEEDVSGDCEAPTMQIEAPTTVVTEKRLAVAATEVVVMVIWRRPPGNHNRRSNTREANHHNTAGTNRAPWMATAAQTQRRGNRNRRSTILEALPHNTPGTNRVPWTTMVEVLMAEVVTTSHRWMVRRQEAKNLPNCESH